LALSSIASHSLKSCTSKLWLADDGVGEDSEGKGLLYGRIKNVVYNEVFSYLLALAEPIHSVVL
jgi:hypothetical protein